MIIFPGGTTTANQPDDNGIIGSIQKKQKSIRSHDYDFRLSGVGEDRLVSMKCLHIAVVQTLSDYRLTSKAWKVTGIFPLYESVHYMDRESRKLILPDQVKSSVDIVVPTSGRKIPISSAVLTSNSSISDRIREESDRNKTKREARQAKRGIRPRGKSSKPQKAANNSITIAPQSNYFF